MKLKRHKNVSLYLLKFKSLIQQLSVLLFSKKKTNNDQFYSKYLTFLLFLAFVLTL